MSEIRLALLVPPKPAERATELRDLWETALREATGYDVGHVHSVGNSRSANPGDLTGVYDADALVLATYNRSPLVPDLGTLRLVALAAGVRKPVFSQQSGELIIPRGVDPEFDPDAIIHIGNGPEGLQLIRTTLEGEQS